MQRIDAHQHFWQYNPVRDSWITEEMQVIRRDFLPNDLAPLLQQHQFDGCVLVQAEETEDGNAFMLQLAKEHSFIKGIVGWVDLLSSNIEERLAYFRSFEQIKGFRYVLQGAADRALMLQPSFIRGMKALAQTPYTYDLLIYPDQLPFARQLVALFPKQPFVVDHLAKPYIRDQKINSWKKEIEALAQYPNTFCKVSGLVTEGAWQDWKKEDFFPYLDVVVAAFGTERILFGSDWPVSLLAASYAAVLDIVETYFASFTASEQQLFFGGNAIRFYNLK